jgi:ketosteroid isomerase-like protein
MWPGAPAIVGHEALRAWFETRFSEYEIELESETLELRIFGQWAYERGRSVSKIRKKDTGSVQTVTGKYLNVLRQQPDGTWRISRRIRNADHPVLNISSAGYENTADLFERYITASNDHDLEALEAMTSDGIIWKLGPYTLVGKGQALGPHALDAAMHTSLEPRDIVIRGDTVECLLIERNDVTRAFEVDSTVHYARYVFNEGLMFRKEPWRQLPDTSDFQDNLAQFRRWLSRVRPNDLVRLDSLRQISNFSFEIGVLRSRLLKAWVDSGRP